MRNRKHHQPKQADRKQIEAPMNSGCSTQERASKPNHALQRTGGHGTQSAKGTAAAFPRTAQPARHARPSLSLGSLGVATHHFYPTNTPQ